METGFKILNKDGEAIKINELDKEAAEFWKVELKEKEYASPINKKGKSTINWYDLIGYKIANPIHPFKKYSGEWTNLISDMISERIGDLFIDTDSEAKGEIIIEKFGEKSIDDKTFLSLSDKVETEIYFVLEYYKPYIDLINHWHSKGYKPVQVKF